MRVYISVKKLVAIALMSLCYACYILFFPEIEHHQIGSREVFITCWIGIFLIAMIFIGWFKIKGKLLTLFNMFLAFMVVFNFGQCVLWAFGIHTNLEIGKNLMFSRVAASLEDIFKMQIIFIISFLALNFGAYMVVNFRRSNQQKFIDYSINASIIGENVREYKALFITAVIIACIAFPLTFFRNIQTYRNVVLLGYRNLEKAQYVFFSKTVLDIAYTLFFPAILGLLIGSGYKKNITYFAYGIFGIYAFLSLLGGDRGEWITRGCVLAWAEITFHRKIRWKEATRLILVMLVLFIFSSAIISLRNMGGFSVNGFVQAVTDSNRNPFISTIMEFGHTMSIIGILIKKKVVYPYGNTYLVSLLTILSTGLTNGLLGTEYVALQDWFSKDYLRISYGADFSMIGEAILNYGIYWAPLVIMIFGAGIFRLSEYPYGNTKKPFQICMYLCFISNILKYPRATLWFVLNNSVYSIMIPFVVYMFVKVVMPRRESISKKQGEVT